METVVPLNYDYDTQLKEWINHEKAAIDLINYVGKLWFDKSVELVLFRNQLVDKSSSEIMQLHLYAKDFVRKPITVKDTAQLARVIYESDICPSRIDIGRLAYEWHHEKHQYSSYQDFIHQKLSHLIGSKHCIVPKDVVLYGFGRIGRLVARDLIALAGKGEQLRLRAIVVRGSIKEELTKRADLLRNDSIHGPFPGTVIEDYKNTALIINGHTVYMIAADKFDQIDYTKYGIRDALLIDNTGVFRDREKLSLHLKSKGIAKVLLTAPGKGDIPNVVYGINHESLDLKKEQIFSAASCTTNAIMPILYVLDTEFKIEKGHIETIHSYTNDQNLLDNFHKKYRRGRSAPLNMVITETGADSALKKVLPHLAGKFTANAVRVPTPDGSLAIIYVQLSQEVDKETVNNAVKKYALSGHLVEQIKYEFSNELVSSDIIGNSCPAVFDSQATQVSSDKRSAVVYVWYDNEFGYTRQVVRLAKHLCEVRRPVYY